MFNKNFFEMIEKKIDHAYVIKTSMANGLGLNGVSYDKFLIGVYKNNRDKDHLKKTIGKIVSIEDGFLVVEIWEYQTYCGQNYKLDNHNIIYLAYETIQSVIEVVDYDKRWFEYYKYWE